MFPKLNWSSPKDAQWIAFGNTLKCTSPSDIYLLLKSSDFIVHDLKYAYLDCNISIQRPFVLVLRKWIGDDIHPSLEFRCFVKDNNLTRIVKLTKIYLSAMLQTTIPAYQNRKTPTVYASPSFSKTTFCPFIKNPIVSLVN